jgi:hypothetical protein
MDLRMPRDGILDSLAGACYYLTWPEPVASDEMAVRGCYVHLEQDPRPGWDPELRILVDVGDRLVPVPIHLGQPTLTWSSVEAGPRAAEGGAALEMAGAAMDESRLLAWWVWPLLGALLDPHMVLTRTDVLGDEGRAGRARGGGVDAELRACGASAVGAVRDQADRTGNARPSPSQGTAGRFSCFRGSVRRLS